MPARLSAVGTCAVVLVALSFVWGCEEPTSSSPPPVPSASVAAKALPDSALADSVAAAADRFAALRSPDAPARAALRQWAGAARARGDSLTDTSPTQARPLFKQALRAYRQVGDSAGVADALRGLGQVAEHESKHDRALARYRSALRASRAVEDRAQTAELLHDLGDARKAQGRYEEALVHYGSALSIRRELGDRQGIAHTLNNAGLVYEYRGSYDKALDHYRESLAIKRELGDRKGTANTLNNVGIIQAIQGHYEKALIRWEESLTIKRELGDREGVARTLNNLGNIYKNQGRYGVALSRFQEALALLRDLDNREGIATALNNIGTIRKRQDRYEDALSRYRASLAIKRELGDRQGVARTLPNIGTIYQRQGRYEKALSHHRASLSIKRQLGDRRGVAISLSDVGEVYEGRGRLEAALGQYRRALQINQEIGRREGSALALQNIGTVHLDRGALRAATDTLGQAVRLAEELRLSTTSPDARRSLLATQVDAYRALTTAYIRAGQPDAALRSLERARARLLADHLAGTARGDTTFAVPSAAALHRTLGTDEAALLYANVGSERPLTALVATRDTTVARTLPDSTVRAEVGRAYPDRLRRLRREEGPLATALGRGHTRSTSPRTSLAETIRLYRSVLTRDGTIDSLQHDLARRLHDLLVAPVEPQLRAHETVTVVPTGVLGYLPFETLRGPGEQYLIQRTHLRYAQSLTVLNQLQGRTHARPRQPLLAVGGAAYGGRSPSGDGPLLATARGDSAIGTDEQAAALFRSAERRMDRGRSPHPTYDRLGYGSWPPLYGTQLEVQKLKRTMGTNTTLFTGPAASEARIRELSASGRLARYRRLHFATHGVAVPEAPQLSALVLSQVGASDSLAARDGYLTMREIADLQLQADVAVLSACRTGLGRLVAGEGVVNLSHAFLRAGANATLVSHWRVLDWSTQQFMTATYRRAQADTTSFAEAVTQVKREFIAGRFGERNADPLRWAPFVYYGRE